MYNIINSKCTHTNSSSCHYKNKNVIVRVSDYDNETKDFHRYNDYAVIK